MMRRTDRLLVPGLAGVLAIALLLAGHEATAQGRRDGMRAGSGSAHKQVTRTGPQGGQRTWTESRSWERGEGRFESHRERTGPQGRTRTKDVLAERTESGYQRDTTWTDARGRQATREAELSVDREAGKASKTVDWTGPEGGTASRVTDIVKTESGRTSTTTVTRPDGTTVTYDKTVERELESDE